MKSALIKITDACNNDCLFCFERKTRSYLSKQELSRILEKIPEFDTIILSGGEPTCHPKFLELASMIRDKGLMIEIVTNGRNFTKRIMELVSMSHITFISKDEKAHDAITRAPGSYHETVKAIKDSPTEKTIINLIISRQNQKSIKEEIRFLRGLGAKTIKCTLPFKGTSTQGFEHIRPNLRVIYPQMNEIAHLPDILFEGMPLCFFGFNKAREMAVRVEKRFSIDPRYKDSSGLTRPVECKGNCRSFGSCNGILTEYQEEFLDLL